MRISLGSFLFLFFGKRIIKEIHTINSPFTNHASFLVLGITFSGFEDIFIHFNSLNHIPFAFTQLLSSPPNSQQTKAHI